MKNKSILLGTMITAGSAIGGGMFSLPIVSSGMWFSLAVLSFLLIWYISYLSALMILEANLHYPPGSSFDTFVKDILGKGWSIFLGICVAFMLYILLYAYCSAFGNMAIHVWENSLGKVAANSSTQGLLGLGLGILFSAAIWVSTLFVGRLASILVIGMGISFVIATSGVIANISLTELFSASPPEASYLSYVWAGLPYYITSFGFASVVPSLYKHYGKDVNKIKQSLLYGSIIALLTYIIWLAISFGIIPRHEFVGINETGGNVGDLVSAMELKMGSSSIQSALNLFSYFAIISSFLGVGLSLFDYIADLFDFGNDKKARFITTCISFLPPALASFFFPHGFIAAIGYAGFVLYLAFFFIPFFMIWKLRANRKKGDYQLSGGKVLLGFVFVISTVTAICKVLTMFDLLPVL